MSQTFSEGFESGTLAATITTSNTTFASVHAPPSGGTYAFDATHAAHGSQAAKVATGSTSGDPFGVFDFSDSSTKQWFRTSYYFTAFPPATLALTQAGTASGGTGLVCRWEITTAGKLFLADNTGTAHTLGSAIPLNKWFRVEGWVQQNASTGQVSLSRFDVLDGVTPAETFTSAANRNTGSAAPVGWQLGGFGNGVVNVGPFWADDVAVSSAGPLGPVSPAQFDSAAFLPFL